MDKQRKKFEEWYEAAAMPAEANWFKRDRDDPDYYDSVAVQSAWEGWQAALASRDSYIVAASSEALKEFVNSPDTLTPGAVQWVRNDPPNLSAAVAAAIEQCAKVCEPPVYPNGISEYRGGWADAHEKLQKKIRALQTEDGLAALRELIEKAVRDARQYNYERNEWEFGSVHDVVDHILKGK